MRPRGRPALGTALAVAGAVALCAGGAFAVTAASALLQDVAETGMPGHLMLRSEPGNPLWQDLGPGETVHWVVQARLEDAPASSLAMQLRSSGGLVDAGGMTIEVTECDAALTAAAQPQDPPLCGGQATVVVAQQALAQVASAVQSDTYVLAPLLQQHPRHLLVTLGIPATANPADVAVGSARVGVGLFVTGDDPAVPPAAPPDRLAVTGGQVAALALLGCGMAGVGAGIVLRRSRADRRPSDRRRR